MQRAGEATARQRAFLRRAGQVDPGFSVVARSAAPVVLHARAPHLRSGGTDVKAYAARAKQLQQLAERKCRDGYASCRHRLVGQTLRTDGRQLSAVTTLSMEQSRQQQLVTICGTK